VFNLISAIKIGCFDNTSYQLNIYIKAASSLADKKGCDKQPLQCQHTVKYFHTTESTLSGTLRFKYKW